MKRRGFTLVELLIVIVVIGILSAMMMLSSTEAIDSSKAMKIVSDLRNVKEAVLAHYADSSDYYQINTPNANDIAACTKRYLGDGNNSVKLVGTTSEPKTGGSGVAADTFYIYLTNNNQQWWLCYRIVDKGGNVTKKLAGRASSLSLKKEPKTNSVAFGSSGEDSNVWVQIR